MSLLSECLCRFKALQHTATACCSVLQCVAVLFICRYSVNVYVALEHCNTLQQRVAVCCSVLQCSLYAATQWMFMSLLNCIWVCSVVNVYVATPVVNVYVATQSIGECICCYSVFIATQWMYMSLYMSNVYVKAPRDTSPLTPLLSYLYSWTKCFLMCAEVNTVNIYHAPRGA